MSEHFMHLDAQEQKDILETLAIEMGRKSNVLEKDVWVCWALDVMFTIPDALPMAFKGGTSLSKVFRSINRFSEDIDITVDYRALAKHIGDDFDPFAESASNNQIGKYSDRLKAGLAEYAEEKIIPHIQACTHLLPHHDQIEIEYAGDGEKIWINFSSVVEEQDDYLRSSVLIELGGRNIIDPNAVHTVTPDIAERLVEQPLTFPTADAVVLAPERTFWEKATLIHSECNRGSMRAGASRLSRHWYDLYLLNNSGVGQSALAEASLLEDVVKHKKCFFRSGFSNYDACLAKNFKLIPGIETRTELEKDYRDMQGMIYGEAPGFTQIMDGISELEQSLNAEA